MTGDPLVRLMALRYAGASLMGLIPMLYLIAADGTGRDEQILFASGWLAVWAVAWAVRRLHDGVLEVLRPVRVIESALVLYGLLVTLAVLNLMTGATRDLIGFTPVLLFAQGVLMLVAADEMGFVGVLLNSLLAMILATQLASPDLLWPGLLAYLLVSCLTLIARHQEQVLASYPMQRPAPIGPLLWQLLLVGGLAIGLALPIGIGVADLQFPDVPLKATLPVRRPGWFGLTVALAGLTVLVTILLRALERLFGMRRKRDRKPAGQAEVEQLFAEPEVIGRAPRRSALRLLRSPRERLIDEYCWLLKRLGQRGHRRPGFQTGREFATRLTHVHPELAEPVRAITTLFYRARYTPAEVDREDVLEAHRLAREILARVLG